MRQTKRVKQRRFRTFFALVLILILISILVYIGYLINPVLCFLIFMLGLLILERFTWYKFK